MNILLLSRYTRLGASSRLRTMQYLPALNSAGLRVRVVPFFDDAYLHALYSGKPPGGFTLKYLFQRIRRLRPQPRPDLIWLEYEALPWIPWLLERNLLPRRVPLVSDYDDAVFHRYDNHRRGAIRAVLGKKIGRVMKASTLVFAGNDYLADYAERSGAEHIEIVPTVVDLDSYTIPGRGKQSGQPTIGWIGSPTTWNAYMLPVMPLLSDLAAGQKARIMAVGAVATRPAEPLLDILPWTEDSEVSRIQDMDIGVMPLTDTPWARGKCGYKLIQYMACGLPVVASPVGVSRQIVEHGVNGFLAATADEWRDALTALLRDPALRQKMGQAGRRKVQAQYSLQVWGPRVAELLREAGRNGQIN